MPLQIKPQEIYLLERYRSLGYFEEMRDTWEKMVKHVESCLQSYLSNLPAKYRSMPLPEQPDVVWAHRVLPNFRDTLHDLYTGFILLSHGDVSALNYAHGPKNDYKGQLDYSTNWMSTEDRDLYESLLMKAKTMAVHITATEGAYWRPRDLSDYSDQFEPLNPPDQWPTYRINQKISVRTGTKTPRSGIYVPDLADSCAEFLSTNYAEAPQAYVVVGFRDLLDPGTGEKYGEEPILEKKDCVWHLVERIDDRNTRESSDVIRSTQTVRVAAGNSCPETGFYFTPARSDSRRLFKKGDAMPDFDADYGTTIWQWDSDQKSL
jgi:hypothetical protein